MTENNIIELDSYEGHEPDLKIFILKQGEKLLKKCEFKSLVEYLQIGENTNAKRQDKLNEYFPLVFFTEVEAKKYGFMIPCGYKGRIHTYNGITCDPENLRLIKTIDFNEGIGFHEKLEQFECPSCKKIWLIKEVYDSHKGYMRDCSTLNEKKSIRTYLTLNLDVSLPEFDDLNSFEKINKVEIPDPNPQLEYSKQKEHEFKLLISKINSSTTDILIGYAFWNINDLKLIQKELNVSGKNISGVYLPSLKRREKILAQSLKEYAVHNRWTDYPPGYIEQQFEKSSDNIESIKNELKKSNIKIIEI